MYLADLTWPDVASLSKDTLVEIIQRVIAWDGRSWEAGTSIA